MSDISFGTDGWRAVIARDFTYENLEKVSRATAQWLLRENEEPSAIIGYDTRFEGEAFAQFVACVMATAGVRVQLSDTFVTTPAVSWATQEGGHSAGIMLTASHNPPSYNGFKIKSEFGGPATPEMIADVEKELSAVRESAEPRGEEALRSEGLIESIPLRSQYIDLLAERIDIDAIKEANSRIVYDAMYGAGQGVLTELLGTGRVVELHHDVNPGMNGVAPEPIERNLSDVPDAVTDNTCIAGLATDGDGDRIGLFDEEGAFVDAHTIFALLVKYLFEEKDLTGDIVKTFSTTDMLDRMGESYGLRVITTPIGFKHIGPRMAEGFVLVGGEESGGMAVKGHIPDRDGLHIGLLLIEMIVKRERTLSGLIRELTEEFGSFFRNRADLHTTEEKKQAFLARLESEGLSSITGKNVESTETLDGFKFRIDGGWLMFRPSGTEPVLRVYAEAESEEEAKSLVEAGVALLDAG